MYILQSPFIHFLCCTPVEHQLNVIVICMYLSFSHTFLSKMEFSGKTVKELQAFLKDRCVSIANQPKAGLIDLCKAAFELGLEVDPDGLLENREEIIQEKLTCDGSQLTNPMLLQNFTDSIESLPALSIFDIYNYLLSFASYGEGTFRDYRKMESYTMAIDGYVLDLKCAPQTIPGVFAVKSRVKPRTREKDPISKLPYYNVWIILRPTESNRVFSAWCSCKGG